MLPQSHPLTCLDPHCLHKNNFFTPCVSLVLTVWRPEVAIRTFMEDIIMDFYMFFKSFLKDHFVIIDIAFNTYDNDMKLLLIPT